MLTKMHTLIPILLLTLSQTLTCQGETALPAIEDEDPFARYDMLFARHKAKKEAKAKLLAGEKPESSSWIETIRSSLVHQSQPKSIINPMIAEIERRIEEQHLKEQMESNQPGPQSGRRVLQGGDTPLADDFDKVDDGSGKTAGTTPTRKEIDLKTMCDGDKTDKDGLCTVKDSQITLTKTATYKNDKIVSLVFDNTVIVCQKGDVFCDVTIELTSAADDAPQPLLSLLNKSEIRGRSIFVLMPGGQLIIDGSSSLNSDGTSLEETGTDKRNAQAASFLGQGGFCGDSAPFKDFTYGKFDQKAAHLSTKNKTTAARLAGSVGMVAKDGDKMNIRTAGGGRIHIEVESFSLQGRGRQITAVGLPNAGARSSENLNGGSGGYIYIKTSEKKSQSKLFYGARIDVSGGYGQKQGFGGAGGSVYYDGEFALGPRTTYIHGGLAGSAHKNALPEGCGNGASGTAYYKSYDVLYADNGRHNSDKVTNVGVTFNRNKEEYPDTYMVANDIYLRHTAILNVKGPLKENQRLVTPIIDMVDDGTVIFDFPGSAQLVLLYDDHFFVGSQTLLDFTAISANTHIEPYSHGEETYWGSVHLGQVKFTRALKVTDHTNSVNLLSNITEVGAPATRHGYIELYSTKVRLFRGSTLSAQNTFIFANETIHMHDSSKIYSQVENECALTPKLRASGDANLDLYQCMNFDLNANKPLDFDYIIDYYHTQYAPKKASDIIFMKDKIIKKWRVYLMSLGSIIIDGANIEAPRIGLCSNDITINESNVTASHKGCPSDQGWGSHPRRRGCSGSGAAHGGDGGSGASHADTGDWHDRCSQSTEYPEAYYRGREARFEGSGGTSGETTSALPGANPWSDDHLMVPGHHGGPGGGIIWLTTPRTLDIRNTTISVNGKKGEIKDLDEAGAGGGSGGSIQLQMQNLRGNGQFQLKGGDGSRQGGGGGAGGRLSINFLEGFKANSQPAQSHYWYGSVDVSGGAPGVAEDRFAAARAGQNGTVFTSKCYPGYAGPFCSACPVGTFKYGFSYGSCQPCLNKPENSYYNAEAQGKASCSYECNFWESAEINKECLNPLDEEFEEIGGSIPFFGLVSLFCAIGLLIFFALSTRSKDIQIALKMIPERIYTVWEDQEGNEQGRGRTFENDFSLNDQCVWAHTHRMYLIGSNSIEHPWIIPKDFPIDALDQANADKLIQFIDNYNQTLQWEVFEKFTFYVVSFLYYPLSKTYHTFAREQKFVALQTALYRTFPPQFWGDNGNNKTIRLGCSKDDYMLAYIDFLDFSKNKATWPGLKIPMPVLLAGAGTYNHPYRLDYIEDSYVKSLVLMDHQLLEDKLPAFLENFNSELSQLSFYKLHGIVARDLYNAIKWVERANRLMFNHLNVKCVLHICENTTILTAEDATSRTFKQSRKSFPLEAIFIDSFPGMYSDLIDYVKLRLHSGSSEIRLLLSFRKFSRSKAIGSRMRVDRMRQAGKRGHLRAAYDEAIKRQESILFDETDTDKTDQKISYIGKPQTIQSADAPEQEKQAKEQEKYMKVRDKKWRAFSYSIEACKLFELALRKPRNKCGDTLFYVKNFLNGTYRLFINHHGSPTVQKDLSQYFALYSAALAFDITLLINFTFHIFMKGDNFPNFGWVFFFVLFGVPYLSPLFAIIAAVQGSNSWLKLSGNMNSMCVCFNIPLTAIACMASGDDPFYLIILALMLALKCGLSALSAKIGQFLANPRYGQNRAYIRKVLQAQALKRNKQVEVLGVEVVTQLDNMRDDNIETKKMLMGIEATAEMPPSRYDTSDLDVALLRDKSLEMYNR